MDSGKPALRFETLAYPITDNHVRYQNANASYMSDRISCQSPRLHSAAVVDLYMSTLWRANRFLEEETCEHDDNISPGGDALVWSPTNRNTDMIVQWAMLRRTTFRGFFFSHFSARLVDNVTIHHSSAVPEHVSGSSTELLFV